MKLIRAGEMPSKTFDPSWYTGTVWATVLAIGDTVPPVSAVLATFLPGARTAWHTHPFDQILVGVTGSGRVQLAGEPARVLNPGDSVVIAPGERHWHGAGPGQVFAHISIQTTAPDGTTATWSDLVTDAEYNEPMHTD